MTPFCDSVHAQYPKEGSLGWSAIRDLWLPSPALLPPAEAVSWQEGDDVTQQGLRSLFSITPTSSLLIPAWPWCLISKKNHYITEAAKPKKTAPQGPCATQPRKIGSQIPLPEFFTIFLLAKARQIFHLLQLCSQSSDCSANASSQWLFQQAWSCTFHINKYSRGILFFQNQG